MSDHLDHGATPGRFGWLLRRRIEREQGSWSPTPIELDDAHVQALLLGNESDPHGLIARHERHRFGEGAGMAWPRFRELGVMIDDAIASSKSFIKTQTAAIAKMPRRTVLNERASSWTLFDYVTVILCAMAAVGLLYLSWRALAVILMKSAGVETEADASAFSVIPLGGAFVLKVIAGWLGEEARKRYIGCLAFCSVVGTIVWSYLFAHTYGHGMSGQLPTFGEDVAEPGTDLTETMLTIGMIVESAIASVLWLSIDRVVNSHRATEANRDRTRLEREVHRVRVGMLWLQASARPRNEEILSWHTDAQKALVQRAIDRFDHLDGLRRNTAFVLDLQHQRDAGPFRSPERGFRDRTNEIHQPNGNGAAER